MKAKTVSPRGDGGLYATLADVRLVLLAPVLIQTKRSGYRKAEVAFLSARMKFIAQAILYQVPIRLIGLAVLLAVSIMRVPIVAIGPER